MSSFKASSADIADFENMLSLDMPIKSNMATRWERKQKQGASSSSGLNLSSRSLQKVPLSENMDINESSVSSMDRFIPSRSAMNFEQSIMDSAHDRMTDDMNTRAEDTDYAKLVSEVSGNNTSNARILSYKNKAPQPQEEHVSSLKVLYSVQGGAKKSSDSIVKPTRHIPSAPVRVLDAPEMLDDYYLNLMSWSSTNILAVALSQTLYLWDASTGSIKELMSVDGEDDYISSVSWIQQGGSHIAIGTASNSVQLWDVSAGKQVRSMSGHSSRIGALAWNDFLLASGSRDTTILNHDVRIQQHIVGRMTNHSQEVCGLSWSPDGSYLASGANDNTLCIYDAASTSSMNAQAKFVLSEHQAAVKALAWSPHERNLLASGGGTADRSIKFWNASTGSLLNSIDTGSQVCALQWSPYEKELLSSHGYAENQLCLWKYPTMAKIKELKGHTARVLHLQTSPEGLVCSGAADETLRFWNIFASESSGKRKGDALSGITPAGSLSSRSNKLCLR
jgi:cell division cycle 20, cofactor of APC complex